MLLWSESVHQYEIMQDPVFCADGSTYERAAIAVWLHSHDTSPATNLPLPNKRLTSNTALRHAIANYLEEHLSHM